MKRSTAGAAPLPFTVIGGFLGSGKSTLLNHLLRESAGRRIAVLVNDFGSVNIDASMIAAHEGDTIALTNGCICCSLAGEFVSVLPKLLDREPPLDHVVVEASGVSDPFAVGQYGTLPGFRLEGVIVLADAETSRARARDPRIGHQVRRQLERADLLVVNKTDLVTPALLVEVTGWLRSIVPAARIVPARAGSLPISLLLGELRVDQETEHSQPEAGGHNLATRSWHARLPIDRAALQAIIDAMPPEILRLKGRVCEADQLARWLDVQVVGKRSRLRDGSARSPEEPSILVAIASSDAIEALGQRLSTIGFVETDRH
jgi:G3E family GTPase